MANSLKLFCSSEQDPLHPNGRYAILPPTKIAFQLYLMDIQSVIIEGGANLLKLLVHLINLKSIEYNSLSL